MVSVVVHSLAVDATTDTPVVILREAEGRRVLPIWIGPTEAAAIAVRIHEVSFERPLTHDLATDFIATLGGCVTKVVVRRVVDATYFAEIHLEREGDTFIVDARPSDSVAIALRAGAEISVAEELLSLPEEWDAQDGASWFARHDEADG